MSLTGREAERKALGSCCVRTGQEDREGGLLLHERRPGSAMAMEPSCVLKLSKQELPVPV